MSLVLVVIDQREEVTIDSKATSLSLSTMTLSHERYSGARNYSTPSGTFSVFVLEQWFPKLGSGPQVGSPKCFGVPR